MWLKNKTNREIAAILIPVCIAIVGGAWTAFSFFIKQPKTVLEVTYHVCRAEERRMCSREAAVYLPCEPVDIPKWANLECTKYSKDELYKGLPGTKCGVEEAIIKCTIER